MITRYLSVSCKISRFMSPHLIISSFLRNRVAQLGIPEPPEQRWTGEGAQTKQPATLHITVDSKKLERGGREISAGRSSFIGLGLENCCVPTLWLPLQRR